ncbi:hypothetical protein HG66A1_56350 [Gimesia chilikensis]|uniref:Uncharacterized protein n=1 Tax=Gimesia chilikensis TaxID=2605989 RepID=A0A517PWR2_9PLAN|nr:hypothetical protein HG66A1_56350 [Gimesia chilikensis]
MPKDDSQGNFYSKNQKSKRLIPTSLLLTSNSRYAPLTIMTTENQNTLNLFRKSEKTM